MSLAADLKTLFQLTVAPIRGANHAERLESFYAPQAASYDATRAGMLAGRDEMYRAIEPSEGAVWLDLGGGTAANLEAIPPERLARCARVTVVDLSPSLLSVAQKRIERHGWHQVETLRADVTNLPGSMGSVDVVTFSYSLTMIPDWFAALESAERLLKPGGWIGVVDFYVSRKHPVAGLRKHGWLTRNFWPVWFGSDNVHPNPDHLPYLCRHFEPVAVRESQATIRFLPLVRVPYYSFIGRKRHEG